MNPDNRPELELRDWLARQEPPGSPDRVVDAVLARVSVTNQGPRPSVWLSLGAVAAALAVVAIGLGNGIIPHRGPFAAPNAAATPDRGERLPDRAVVIDMPGRDTWTGSEHVGLTVGNGSSAWAQSDIDHISGMRRIDPVTNQVTATVSDTWGMAFRGTELWALRYTPPCCSAGVLVRLDPVSGTELARFEDVAGFDIAIDGDTAWVTNGAAGTVERVDLTSGEIVATIHLGQGALSLTWPMLGGGYVWVGSEGVIYRIDPVTDSVTATIEVDGATGNTGSQSAAWVSLAYANGALWARIERTRLLWRIDPDTAAVTDQYDVGNWQGGIAAANDRLWITVPGGVAEFDTDAGILATPQRLPWAFYEISAIGDDIWVSLGESLRIIRFPMPE